MSRTVTLALLDAAGRPLGALPPYEVPMPWWQEVGDVVAGARQRYGVDLTVLRLLVADRPAPHGGAVTYLAQVAAGVVPPAALRPARLDLSGHPLRAAWARPGGGAASVAWAVAALARLGHPRVAARQQRAWNLSAIWRLDVPDGAAGPAPVAWLKQVPPFFGHEPVVLRWLADAAPGLAPPLLAAGPQGRMVLGHVPGRDWYDATPADRDRIAEAVHRVQVRAVAEVDVLVATGLPDRRAARLLRVGQAVAARHGAGVAGLDALVEALPERLAAVTGCGLPDTLLHGDLHPGNARVGPDGTAVILDWGDCVVGHPAFDILRLSEDLAPADADALLAAWAARWRREVPGCAPERAVELLRPVAALRNAAAYADFVVNIEPAERPFHAADVGAWLERAVTAG